MNNTSRFLFSFLLLSLLASFAQAQSNDPSSFTPKAAWDPTFLQQPANQYRTASGHPGPRFWQNHVGYTIRATLDTTKQRIHGSVELTYTNHSPNPLHSVWLYVAPPDTSHGSVRARNHRFEISEVAVVESTKAEKETTTTPYTKSTDTRLQVRLDQPIPANGGSKTLRLTYALPLSTPGLPTRAVTPHGPIYEVAHWFPRVVVYDDRHGWGRSPSQSTDDIHAEYASFDYYITVPASMIVAGSGTLMNPDKVLTNDQQRRLLRARNSDGKVAIISPDQAGTPSTRPKQSGRLTWHFQMNGVREVAWAASPAFIWNAAEIKRPDQRPALAMSYYPRSSMGGNAWNRSTYHVRRAVKFYSKTLYTYPWNTVINVATPKGNLGFPGISMCDYTATGYELFSCTAQAQGKNWFPVMIAPDQNRHPWLVDGLGTFISVLAHRTLYDGEFAPKRDTYYAPDGENPADELLPSFTAEAASPVMTPPDFLAADWHTRLYSFKAAYGFTLLREYILGPKRFEYALRQFANRWTFRQPTPWDFFRTMNDASGENLNWFWKGWFARNWTIDQGIRSVTYVDDNPKNGALITLELNRRLPMPVELKIVNADGKTKRVRRSVEIWQGGTPRTVRISTDRRLEKVTLDPDNKLPDVNSSNDTWASKKL